MPLRSLTMTEVEIMWSEDRMEYIRCATTKNELLNVLRDRGIINEQD